MPPRGWVPTPQSASNFKHLTWQLYAGRGDSTAECWKKAITIECIKKHLRSYCKLVKVSLVLPSSVENERHFSLMKLLKDATGNRMGTQLLNALCIVQRSEFSEQKDPFREALKVWK